jgi:hypothetical protein
MSSGQKYRILETFDITGRGVAVVIEEIPEFSVGKALLAKVICPDGTGIEATAYREWLLRRSPEPIEKCAFLLRGLEKSQVPVGSYLQIEGYGPNIAFNPDGFAAG